MRSRVEEGENRGEARQGVSERVSEASDRCVEAQSDVMGCTCPGQGEKHVSREERGQQASLDGPHAGTQDKEGESRG